MKDLTTIELISNEYKFLAKVLVVRLKEVLPSIISVLQGVFVHRTLIFDGAFVANECVGSC